LLDLNAPIIPWKGMGNVVLYTHLRDLHESMKKENIKAFLYDNYLVRYEILDKIYLFFNLVNGKLFKITALENYKGKLFGDIYIGMHIDEVLKREPSFVYDDFEEVYCSSKGIYIETDPVEHTVLWISIYIKELDNEDFEKGNW
jgi:hypothetical protein